MVGGGSGGGIHAGGKIGETFPGCLKLNFETVLMSADPETLASIIVDTVLELALREQQGNPIVVALKDTLVIGTIGSPHLAQLIKCMQENHSYVADVLSIEGGACRVRVHHAGQ
jgi:hypothetical protein